MRYIGGKSQLLSAIDAVVSEHVPGGGGLFCDIFAGTGSVARHFKSRFQVISNDILHFSYVIQKATVEANRPPAFERLRAAGIDDPVAYLETADPQLAVRCPFFITNNYAPDRPGADFRLALAGTGRRDADGGDGGAPGGGGGPPETRAEGGGGLFPSECAGGPDGKGGGPAFRGQAILGPSGRPVSESCWGIVFGPDGGLAGRAQALPPARTAPAGIFDSSGGKGVFSGTGPEAAGAPGFGPLAEEVLEAFEGYGCGDDAEVCEERLGSGGAKPLGRPRGGRMYFTRANAERMDFIRHTIDAWRSAGLTTEAEYYHLLARLVEGVPSVSNTAGTYGAYLKSWDRRALKAFAMAPLEIVDNGKENRSYNMDANLLIREVEGEVLYVDPPYTCRQYGSNYHVLETVSRYDSPECRGVTGMRDSPGSRSAFCVRSEVEPAFDDLLDEARFKHIFVSYSTEGIMRPDRLEAVLRRHGASVSFRRYETPYRRYKCRVKGEGRRLCEYVFYVKKGRRKATRPPTPDEAMDALDVFARRLDRWEAVGGGASAVPAHAECPFPRNWCRNADGLTPGMAGFRRAGPGPAPAWQPPCPPSRAQRSSQRIAECREYLKSPFNYIGGKYKLLPQIIPRFPDGIGTLYDLFAGGCDVGINARASSVVCNDINKKIIAMYRAFQTRGLDEVLERIDGRINDFGLSEDNAKAYEAFRSFYNATGDPLDLFTLACYSFNYMFRFNSRMEYNNTFGRGRSRFTGTMRKNLVAFMDRIKSSNITFAAGDFSDADTGGLGRGDLVYCDPPYLIAQGIFNDGTRGFKRWGEKEEASLYRLLEDMDSRGVSFALTNVLAHKGQANRLLANWCRDYHVTVLESSYSNSSFNTRRGGSLEVLVTNYVPPAIPGRNGCLGEALDDAIFMARRLGTQDDAEVGLPYRIQADVLRTGRTPAGLPVILDVTEVPDWPNWPVRRERAAATAGASRPPKAGKGGGRKQKQQAKPPGKAAQRAAGTASETAPKATGKPAATPVASGSVPAAGVVGRLGSKPKAPASPEARSANATADAEAAAPKGARRLGPKPKDGERTQPKASAAAKGAAAKGARRLGPKPKAVAPTRPKASAASNGAAPKGARRLGPKPKDGAPTRPKASAASNGAAAKGARRLGPKPKAGAPTRPKASAASNGAVAKGARRLGPKPKAGARASENAAAKGAGRLGAGPKAPAAPPENGVPAAKGAGRLGDGPKTPATQPANGVPAARAEGAAAAARKGAGGAGTKPKAPARQAAKAAPASRQVAGSHGTEPKAPARQAAKAAPASRKVAGGPGTKPKAPARQAAKAAPASRQVAGSHGTEPKAPARQTAQAAPASLVVVRRRKGEGRTFSSLQARQNGHAEAVPTGTPQGPPPAENGGAPYAGDIADGWFQRDGAALGGGHEPLEGAALDAVPGSMEGAATARGLGHVEGDAPDGGSVPMEGLAHGGGFEPQEGVGAEGGFEPLEGPAPGGGFEPMEGEAPDAGSGHLEGAAGAGFKAPAGASVLADGLEPAEGAAGSGGLGLQDGSPLPGGGGPAEGAAGRGGREHQEGVASADGLEPLKGAALVDGVDPCGGVARDGLEEGRDGLEGERVFFPQNGWKGEL
jgi:adenine-specific DNA-methyltransferase